MIPIEVYLCGECAPSIQPTDLTSYKNEQLLPDEIKKLDKKNLDLNQLKDKHIII